MSNDLGVPPEWALDKIFMLGTDTEYIHFCDEVIDLFVNEDNCGFENVYYAIEVAPDVRSTNPDQYAGIMEFSQEESYFETSEDFPRELFLTNDIGNEGMWELTYRRCTEVPCEATESLKQYYNVIYPCRDTTLVVDEPFASGIFSADFDELVSETGFSWDLEDYIHPNYGEYHSEFEWDGGSCPPLIFTLSDDLSYEAGVYLYPYDTHFDFQPDIFSYIGEHETTLTIEQLALEEDENNLHLQDIPLSFNISNRCKPTSFYIFDSSEDMSTTLYDQGYQVGWQKDEAIHWGQSEMAFTGISEGSNFNCPTPVLGMYLLVAVDRSTGEQLENVNFTEMGGLNGPYTDQNEPNQPVRLIGPSFQYQRMRFKPTCNDAVGTYYYDLIYYWGGIEYIDADYIYLDASLEFHVEPNEECVNGEDDDSDPVDEVVIEPSSGTIYITSLVRADSGTLNPCEIVKTVFEELHYCGSDEDSTEMEIYGSNDFTQTILGSLTIKESDHELIVFNDSDVGVWTVEAVLVDNSDVNNRIALRQTTFYIDVESPCMSAEMVYADEAIQEGVFDFDPRYENVNLNLDLMRFTLDLTDSVYGEMFIDQNGSCPPPMLAAESFNLIWGMYQDSTYNDQYTILGGELEAITSRIFLDIQGNSDFIIEGGFSPETTTTTTTGGYRRLQAGLSSSKMTLPGLNVELVVDVGSDIAPGIYNATLEVKVDEWVGLPDYTLLYKQLSFQIGLSGIDLSNCIPEPRNQYYLSYTGIQGEASTYVSIDPTSLLDFGSLPDDCPTDTTFSLQLHGIFIPTDGTYSNNVDSTEQGGPFNSSISASDPDMPAEYSPSVVLFEPSERDMPGQYEYSLFHYYGGSLDKTLYQDVLFFTFYVEQPIGDLSDPNEIFLQAETLLQDVLPTVWNMGVNVEEVIDLSQVINFIDTKREYSPNLQLEIDLQKTTDFVNYDQKSGEMTILANSTDIGSYVISSLLSDGNNDFRWDMYLYIEDLTNWDWYSDEVIDGDYDLDCWSSCAEDDDACWHQCDVINGYVDVGSEDCYSSCGYNDDDCWITCDEPYGSDDNFEELTICYSFCDWDDDYCWDACDHAHDIDTTGHSDFVYFDPDVTCSDVNECALFNSTDTGDLNDEELNEYIEELGEVSLSIEVEGQKINVTLGNLTSETASIQEIFADEQFNELSSQSQQVVLEQLLQYNVKYLEEMRLLKEQHHRTTEFIEEPKLAFISIEPTGEFSIIFDEEILGLAFLEKLNKGLASRGTVTEESGRRQLDNVTDASNFDLHEYLEFKVQRGGEDSAEGDSLRFNVSTRGVYQDQLEFLISFENPNLVSIGSISDLLIMEVVNPNFFSSARTGTKIPAGYKLSKSLPRMLSSEDFIAVFALAQEGVEITIQAVTISQIIITLVLAASLKSMWNLLNVVQVLAYMRFYTRWPALMAQILLWMENAVTMKPVSDKIFDIGKSKFDLAKQTLTDQSLLEAGITDPNLIRGLGVFSIVLILNLLGVAIYVLLSAMTRGHCKWLKTPRDFIHRKLFYNGFLRYLIVSNLKLTITAWAFFIYQQSDGVQVKAAGFFVGIIVLLVYPVLFMYFLLKNQDSLEQPKTRQKFSSVYDGIYTESKQALLYNTVFCLRRFYIVFVNTVFNVSCPFTDFEQSRYFYKIILFLLIQSVYLLYVESTRPHTMTLFNRLEVFNESALMLLAYIMIAFSGIVEGQATGNKLAELLAFSVTVSILIGNFSVLFSRTIWKVKLISKKRKLQKQAKLRRETRLAMRKTNRVETEPADTMSTQGTARRLTADQTPGRTATGSRSSHHFKDQDLDDAFKVEYRLDGETQFAAKLDQVDFSRLNAIKEVSYDDVSPLPKAWKSSGRSSLYESMASDQEGATPKDRGPKPFLVIQDDKLIAMATRQVRTSTFRRRGEIRQALDHIDEIKDHILKELDTDEQAMITIPQTEELKVPHTEEVMTERHRNSVENCFNIGIEEEFPRSRQVQRYKTFAGQLIEEIDMDRNTPMQAFKSSQESGSGMQVIEQSRGEVLSLDTNIKEM